MWREEKSANVLGDERGVAGNRRRRLGEPRTTSHRLCVVWRRENQVLSSHKPTPTPASLSLSLGFLIARTLVTSSANATRIHAESNCGTVQKTVANNDGIRLRRQETTPTIHCTRNVTQENLAGRTCISKRLQAKTPSRPPFPTTVARTAVVYSTPKRAHNQKVHTLRRQPKRAHNSARTRAAEEGTLGVAGDHDVPSTVHREGARRVAHVSVGVSVVHPAPAPRAPPPLGPIPPAQPHHDVVARAGCCVSVEPSTSSDD